MTVLSMYFPAEVIFVFVSTLAAILLTHLAICIVFGFFDLQKYSMSWLLPVSLAACVLYIPSLLAEPMVLLLYFALAVFSVVRYIGLKKTLARCQEAGTLKIFHLVPHGGTNYVHGAVSAAPIIMQENYGMDLSGKIFVGDDLILSNIGFLFEPDAEYEVQCEKVGEEDSHALYQALIIKVLHRKFSLKRVLGRMIALYGNIAAVISFSAIVCVSIMDAASYFPIEWYARCVNTLSTIGGTVLFYAASKVLGKGKILRVIMRVLFYIMLFCTILYTFGIVPVKVEMYPPYM